MILQICPSDYPPFRDICTAYELALRSSGRNVSTVILQPPAGEPIPGFHYLSRQDLRATRSMAAQLAKEVDTQDTLLAICHRYRSSQVAKSLRVKRLVVAHEFGYFDRLGRRIAARFESDAWYAGVSLPVVSELEAVCGSALHLPNAVDVEGLAAERLTSSQAKAELALPESDRIVGWVGRLHPKKRPELAVAAAAQMPNDITLAMLGDGDVALSTDAARVVRCGFVEQARRYYRAFDVLLITATTAEAFGMTALEAMCAGVPVVCSRAPGPASVLGELGCYYDDDEPASIAAAVGQALSIDTSEYAQRSAQRVEKYFSLPALTKHLDAAIGVTTNN